MKKIIIAGAGGIGRSVALILAEWSKEPYSIYVGDGIEETVKEVVSWLKENITNSKVVVDGFVLPFEGESNEMIETFQLGDVILDCLPGKQAPRIARLAEKYNMHYANLTEYVYETEEIMKIANKSSQGFVLQTGLAPGFINILTNSLFSKFCKKHQVKKVDSILMVVGAITQTAKHPHYYGFTWSPIGVATEYLEETNVIRDYKKTKVAALSEREKIIIDNTEYEIDITSGGAADLPDNLEGKVKKLDYKTLRYLGHYNWVKNKLKEMPNDVDLTKGLQEIMENEIPRKENDIVVIFSSVTGKDESGVIQEEEKYFKIYPTKVGNTTLRAIQVTTASPLAQMAELLLTNSIQGPLLQTQVNYRDFFECNYIKKMIEFGNQLK
jgi:saccharopine dehydrogenase-like NADP-dependent oxidoreductase